MVCESGVEGSTHLATSGGGGHHGIPNGLQGPCCDTVKGWWGEAPAGDVHAVGSRKAGGVVHARLANPRRGWESFQGRAAGSHPSRHLGRPGSPRKGHGSMYQTSE